jgi:hypothetical protein
LLYSLDPSDYGTEEMRHIPLVYALMALGCLSEKIDEGLSESGDDIIAERYNISLCHETEISHIR